MDEEILIYTCLDRKCAVQKYSCILNRYMLEILLHTYLGYPTARTRSDFSFSKADIFSTLLSESTLEVILVPMYPPSQTLRNRALPLRL